MRSVKMEVFMADKVKNIFVSHQHNDADKIEEFKEEGCKLFS